MTALLRADHLAGSGDRDDVIASGSCVFAKFHFMGIATKVGIEGEGNEVFVDETRIDLRPGVPPGAV